MTTLHTIGAAFGLVSLLALGLSSPAQACEPPDDCTVDLIAGQHYDVGSVTFGDDGTDLSVSYTVDEGDWYLVETHLYAAPECPDKFAPGQFPYAHDGIYATSDAYTLPLYDLGVSGWEELCFAAHAVVERFVGYGPPDLDEFAAGLPAMATITLAFPGGDSYFNVTISGGTSIDGVWDDFCVDTDRTITPGATYTAYVVSSYDDATGLVEFPENLDLVNWILNAGYVGTASADCGGNYTYGDVQRAIWGLIEDAQSTSGLGSWSECRAAEIMADAYAHGEGFEPACGDFVGVLLVPGTLAYPTHQITIAAIEADCTEIYEDETAWAQLSYEIPKKWGWYGYCE